MQMVGLFEVFRLRLFQQQHVILKRPGVVHLLLTVP
jgi:hypothetical protein